MHGGALFELRDGFKLGGELFDQLEAFVDMGVFATTEDDRKDHLVLLPEELLGPVHLGHEIGLANLRTEPDFFVLALVRVPFVLPLFLLVLEFTKVHDPANGRLLGRRNFDEVESRLLGEVQGFLGRNHTELFAFRRNDADWGNADLLVDPLLLAFDRWSLLWGVGGGALVNKANTKVLAIGTARVNRLRQFLSYGDSSPGGKKGK